MNSVRHLLTELVAEFEQCLGHATGDVGENQVGQCLIGAAKSLGEGLEE